MPTSLVSIRASLVSFRDLKKQAIGHGTFVLNDVKSRRLRFTTGNLTEHNVPLGGQFAMFARLRQG